MAKTYLTSINLSKNELQNARIQNLAVAPSSPEVGQVYFDTTLGMQRTWNGTSWIGADASKSTAGSIPLSVLATDPLARANHTGTQVASTISDFNTAVQANRLDQLTIPTASVNVNNNLVTNVLTPVSGTDAANKNYVDATAAASAAGIDAKASVKCATTANITLSAPQTIDGISATVGSRVLVKNQTTTSQNGIYVVAAGAWVRATDCDSSNNYTAQAFTFVEEGTTLAGTQWKVSTTGTITVDTTAVVWTQFGAAQTYAPGNGLSLAGNVFTVGSGTGIVSAGTTVSIDTSVVARKYSATIGDGSSTSIAVTHNLGTTDVHVQVREVATNAVVECDITNTNTTTSTIGFTIAPATNAYRAVVIG